MTADALPPGSTIGVNASSICEASPSMTPSNTACGPSVAACFLLSFCNSEISSESTTGLALLRLLSLANSSLGAIQEGGETS